MIQRNFKECINKLKKVKRKPQRCGICRMEGYNKKFCPLTNDIQQTNASCATSHDIIRNPFEKSLDADGEMIIFGLTICVPHVNYIIFINKSGDSSIFVCRDCI
ncbi:uncharacterized protein DS421_2g52210 [Arachis hypogaea]|nr:uncharacterized protein DS421_2g52210 [Arachis hypogaea]